MVQDWHGLPQASADAAFAAGDGTAAAAAEGQGVQSPAAPRGKT